MKNQNPAHIRSSIGKIARLPYAIREQLNQRLLDGQPSSVILPWLNALPAVQKILAAKFASAPVNTQNLSNWRAIGFQRWLQARQPVAELAETYALNPAAFQEQLRVVADFCLQVIADDQVKLISDAATPEAEKIEQVGRHLFGENWIPLSN
jgi:hypothetical protein